MSEPIDLGALQKAVQYQRAYLKSLRTQHNACVQKALIAAMTRDKLAKSVDEAKIALDKAETAMIEGARAVANG